MAQPQPSAQTGDPRARTEQEVFTGRRRNDHAERHSVSLSGQDRQGSAEFWLEEGGEKHVTHHSVLAREDLTVPNVKT